EEECMLQIELNIFMKRVHQALKLMAVPRIWQAAGTKISPEYNNIIGNVYKYAGMKPEVDSGTNAVAPELLNRIEGIKDEMREIARLSAIEASGQMQSRNDSQPALQDALEAANTGT